jgi:hypothetical protein
VRRAAHPLLGLYLQTRLQLSRLRLPLCALFTFAHTSTSCAAVNGSSGLRLGSAFVGVVEVVEGGEMVDSEEETMTRKVQSGEDKCESLN